MVKFLRKINIYSNNVTSRYVTLSLNSINNSLFIVCLIRILQCSQLLQFAIKVYSILKKKYTLYLLLLPKEIQKCIMASIASNTAICR